MRFLFMVKHLFDRFFLKLKIKNVGKYAYVKRKYFIRGGAYITLGEGVSIREGASIQCFDSYSSVPLSPCLVIGKNVYINRYISILCADSITIGDNSYFGSFVSICDENHGNSLIDGRCFGEQPLSTGAIVIGSNCWIGDKVTILPGVSVGNNSIIGAGSVVTKNIPDNSIAVGNPARVIKKWDYIKNKWEIFNGEK